MEVQRHFCETSEIKMLIYVKNQQKKRLQVLGTTVDFPWYGENQFRLLALEKAAVFLFIYLFIQYVRVKHDLTHVDMAIK